MYCHKYSGGDGQRAAIPDMANKQTNKQKFSVTHPVTNKSCVVSNATKVAKDYSNLKTTRIAHYRSMLQCAFFWWNLCHNVIGRQMERSIAWTVTPP